jgi:hypothetical protein
MLPQARGSSRDAALVLAKTRELNPFPVGDKGNKAALVGSPHDYMMLLEALEYTRVRMMKEILISIRDQREFRTNRRHEFL